jgi:hypothetical protein
MEAMQGGEPLPTFEEHPPWAACTVEVPRVGILLAFVDEIGQPCATQVGSVATKNPNSGKPHRLAGNNKKDPDRSQAKQRVGDFLKDAIRAAKDAKKVRFRKPTLYIPPVRVLYV